MVVLCSIERVLELDGRDVVEIAVEALRVVPVHPSKRREFEVLDPLPWSGSGGSVDEFGLVVPVHRLGQSVVIRIADRPDRGCRTDLCQTLPVANRGELRSRVAMTPQIIVAGAAGPAGHLNRVEDHLGAHMRRDPPAHDHPGERVDDETHVGDTRPGGYERQIGHPEPVRSGRGELALHQIRVPRRCWLRPCGLHSLRTPCALDTGGTHQSRRLIAANHDPRSARCLPELTDPVDAVVGLPEFDQLRDQRLVAPGTSRRLAGLGGVVTARSHLQQSADELDSEPAAFNQVVLVRVDERDYFR